jgi:indole-3-glycerol phosphate synthase
VPKLEGTILGGIISRRRERLAEAKARVPLRMVRQSAEARSDFRDFGRAVVGDGGAHHIIAEMKRASPSRGILCKKYRRREIAQGYQAAEAAALSVLTEEDHFLGSLQDLVDVRAAVQLPVLRKDFILEPYQVYESAAAGADALLLIVAALEDAELGDLLKLTGELRVAALLEAHDEAEVERAVRAGARLIGVNNRDLKTLEVDIETSFRLRPRIPSGVGAVSESGIRTPQDLRRLREAGYDAALIGERFMTAQDPGKELAEFLKLEPWLAKARP